MWSLTAHDKLHYGIAELFCFIQVDGSTFPISCRTDSDMSATKRKAAILARFKPLNDHDLKLDRSLPHEMDHEDETPRGQKELRPRGGFAARSWTSVGKSGPGLMGLMGVDAGQCSSGSVWKGSTTEQTWTRGYIKSISTVVVGGTEQIPLEEESGLVVASWK